MPPIRNKRPPNDVSLAFLDIVTCGFGAIILLLLISPIGGLDQSLEQPKTDVDTQAPAVTAGDVAPPAVRPTPEQAARMAQEALARDALLAAQARTEAGNAALADLLAERRAELAALVEARDTLTARLRQIEAGQTALANASATLSQALERLDAETQRLKMARSAATDPLLVGGIPVDSEYIIFIIDTSGSMVRFAWDAMLEKMFEILDAYPQVRGIQVMNDMGNYLFPSQRGRFMEDSPSRRRAIASRLRNWNVYSNSSPVEGISAAIRTFGRTDRRVSLYVLGDEFSGGSIDEVLASVRELNPLGADGRPQVRIHAIGFPVQFGQPLHLQRTGVRFSTLMRALTEANGGAFIGLEDFRN